MAMWLTLVQDEGVLSVVSVIPNELSLLSFTTSYLALSYDGNLLPELEPSWRLVHVSTHGETDSIPNVLQCWIMLKS